MEALLGLPDIALGPGEPSLSGGQLFAEPRLLFLQHVQRDGTRVGKVIGDQLTAGAPDAIDFSLAPVQLTAPVVGQEPELLGQLGLQVGDPLGVDPDLPQVVGRHVLLDLLGRDVRQLARQTGVATAADEVVVDLAVLTLALGEDQPPAAESAVNCALEVVAVLPLPFAGQRVGGEYLLDLLEQLRRDQLGVGAFVVDPAEAKATDVVGVAQEPVEG